MDISQLSRSSTCCQALIYEVYGNEFSGLRSSFFCDITQRRSVANRAKETEKIFGLLDLRKWYCSDVPKRW